MTKSFGTEIEINIVEKPKKYDVPTYYTKTIKNKSSVYDIFYLWVNRRTH